MPRDVECVRFARIGHSTLDEFAVRVPDARAVHRRLIERGVLAGLVLADVLPDEPSLSEALLVCATEVTTDAEIERFAAALSAELGGEGRVATADRRATDVPAEAVR